MEETGIKQELYAGKGDTTSLCVFIIVHYIQKRVREITRCEKRRELLWRETRKQKASSCMAFKDQHTALAADKGACIYDGGTIWDRHLDKTNPNHTNQFNSNFN